MSRGDVGLPWTGVKSTTTIDGEVVTTRRHSQNYGKDSDWRAGKQTLLRRGGRSAPRGEGSSENVAGGRLKALKGVLPPRSVPKVSWREGKELSF